MILSIVRSLSCKAIIQGLVNKFALMAFFSHCKVNEFKFISVLF